MDVVVPVTSLALVLALVSPLHPLTRLDEVDMAMSLPENP